jgi:hypothetical protein
MAKKPKGFSELLGQQRRQQSRQAIDQSFDQLEADLGSDLGRDITVLREPAGMAKMSAVLEDFVAPYEDDKATKQELENLFSFGIVAWNLAITPPAERAAMIDKFFTEVLATQDPTFVAEGKELIQELIDRKEQHFGDNQRIIANFKLQYFGPGKFNISVASVMPKPQN